MAEVKKSYFIALDTALSADEISQYYDNAGNAQLLGTGAIPNFSAAVTYNEGDIVLPTDNNAGGYVFRMQNAAITGASDAPLTWGQVSGETTQDAENNIWLNIGVPFYSRLRATNQGDMRTAYLLEPSGLPDLALDYEETTRDVIRNSYLPAAPLRGIINTSSSMTFELHGCGYTSSGTEVREPDYHNFLFSGFSGMSKDNIASGETVHKLSKLPSACYLGETITIQDDTGVAPHDGVAVTSIAANTFIVLRAAADSGIIVVKRTATASVADVVVISKSPDADFASNDATGTYKRLASLAYYMPSTLAAIPQFALAMYRGNIVRELYSNIGVTSLEFPIKAGEICLPNFSFNVAGGNIAAADYETDPLFNTNVATAPSSNLYPPQFAKSVAWQFYVYDADLASGVTDLSKIVDSVSFKLNNEQVARKDITKVDGINDYRISSRTVELTLSAYYEDENTDFTTTNLSKLFLTDTNRLYACATIGDDGTDDANDLGTRVMLVAPRFGFKTKVTEENGLFKYDVTGSAEKDDHYGENVFTIIFF